MCGRPQCGVLAMRQPLRPAAHKAPIVRSLWLTVKMMGKTEQVTRCVETVQQRAVLLVSTSLSGRQGANRTRLTKRLKNLTHNQSGPCGAVN